MGNTEQQKKMVDGRFAEMLRRASFFMVMEQHPNALMDDAVQTELYKFILDDSRIFATAVTDRWDTLALPSVLEFACKAKEQTGKPVLAVLAGKNRSFKDIERELDAFRSAGISDFLAVTGNYVNDKRDGQRNDFPGKYTDSVDIVRLGRESGDVCIGAAVNPFRYMPEELLGQYSKLLRKVNNGASFIVAQTGWDMKKYQEVLWFLRSREVFVPLVARMMVLEKPEEKVTSDQLFPGVQMPLSLTSQLEKECELDAEAFFNVQVQRVAFMAAGCQLMGYSGIQVAGLHNVRELETFLDFFDGMQVRYPTYTAWSKAWNEHFEGVNFAPYAPLFSSVSPFYLYNALLDPRYSQFDTGIAVPSDIKIPLPSLADRVQSSLADPDTPQWIKKTVKHWTGKEQANEENQTHCLGLENSSCPKRLTQGPCGGAKADGTCEACDSPCFFQRVTRLAVWNRQIDYLEDASQD